MATKLREHALSLRIQHPRPGIFENLKHLFKEFIESLKHSYPIKDTVDDIEPPESLGLFQLCRSHFDEDRRGSFMKGSSECLPYGFERVRLLLKPVLACITEVNLRDRTIDMEERFSCVEQDELDWYLH